MSREQFHVARRIALSRRTFLRGAGAMLALPALEAMSPAFAAPAPAVRRLVFVFAPNGKHMPDWTPQETGKDVALPYLLQPLEAVKRHVQVLTNLDMDNARAHGDGPGDHARASACFLTGAHPVKTAGKGLRAGVSADQLAARVVGKRTRFPSLELGLERGRAAGACDSGYACAYSNSISWRTAETPNAKETDPRLVFRRLFGAADQRPTADERETAARRRRSVLDAVARDARSLAGRLGAADRRKLDEYLTGVRELEIRIEKTDDLEPTSVADGFDVGTSFPRDVERHTQLMNDLIVLAFRADLTRVVTFMLGNAGSNRAYRNLRISEGHHQLSHHGNDKGKVGKIKQINRYHVKQLAHLLTGLSDAQEVGGSLLDRSMVVYGSAIADGNRHDHHRVPMLLAGGGDGTLSPGRHVRFPKGTPATNLYLALLDRMGARVQSLGDSTGHLEGI